MANSKSDIRPLSLAQTSLFDLSGNGWFFKYKLHHLPFWFVYHSLWWTISIGDPWKVVTLIFFSQSAIKFSFYLVFQALGVYFNLYFLIPKFLEKGRYVTYIILLLLTIGCSAACIVTGYYFNALVSDKTFQELWGVEPGNFMHFFKINALPSTVASMTLAMSIKLTKNWINAKRREQLLEKEKLETELKFLRSQFNPHFLFNTINSIFVLIDHHYVEFHYADGTVMNSQCRHIKGTYSIVDEMIVGTKGVVKCGAAEIVSKGKSLYKFDKKSENNPYQTEHDELFAAIAKGEYKFQDAENGARATLTAIMGRMATYSGQVMEWDKVLNSGISIMPTRFAWDAEPPVKPDANGFYPIATPGITKFFS